ncbi:MAG TPA: hypothetical protein VN628_11175 [Vicinamibacterales bacterium]|nr:hypothetical protein [Vicinamibacterales bacterium]
MRRVAIAVAAAVLLVSGAARAQGPPPPLPHFVVDVHGVVPVFPNDAQQLADSRGLSVTELPGAGIGGRVGAHVYLFKIEAVTIGVGGEVMLGASSSTPAEGTTGLVPVDERLTSAGSQLSMNFGSGRGWSYLSGGIGRSKWSLHPAGAAQTGSDTESLPTANYGGGARWFAKKHLAFSFDVRLYEIQPGSAVAGRPGSPRTRLLVVGAGVSFK